LLTWTVLDETLVPWLACRLKDVGLTDSAAAAKAEDGSSNAAKTANNATLADRKIMYVLLCAASANRAGLRIYELGEQFSAVRKRTAESLRYSPHQKAPRALMTLRVGTRDPLSAASRRTWRSLKLGRHFRPGRYGLASSSPSVVPAVRRPSIYECNLESIYFLISVARRSRTRDTVISRRLT
jgi:hypothetical protein